MIDPQKITDHLKKVYGCVIVNPYDETTYQHWVTCKDGYSIRLRHDSGVLDVLLMKRCRIVENREDLCTIDLDQLDSLINRGLSEIANDMITRPQPRDIIDMSDWTSYFRMTEHVFRHFELLTEDLDHANEAVYIYDEMLISGMIKE